MTLAKGLGGGFPVGAVIAFGDRAAHLLGRGQHGTTFGGNPVAAAAALATIGVIQRDGLLENVDAVGAHVRESVEALGHPLVTKVRGAGLLRGIALAEPVAAEVAQRALAAGFIVNPVAPDAIRLAPPFILTREQVDDFVAFLATLPATLTDAAPEEA
jgi:acetylornithine aminotransferase